MRAFPSSEVVMRLALALVCLVLAPIAIAAPAPLPTRDQKDKRIQRELARLQGTWQRYEYDDQAQEFERVGGGEVVVLEGRALYRTNLRHRTKRRIALGNIELDLRGPRLRCAYWSRTAWVPYLLDGDWLMIGGEYWHRAPKGAERALPKILPGPANRRFYPEDVGPPRPGKKMGPG
jgi:hypothetical protein